MRAVAMVSVVWICTALAAGPASAQATPEALGAAFLSAIQQGEP